MQRFNFAVDEHYARKNNELLKDTKRLQIASGIFALILGGIGAAFYGWLGGAMGGIILGVFGLMALVFLVLIPVLPKKVGNPTELYANYELVPAIIAEVRPRDMTLLALVNLNVDTAVPPRWGLALRNVTRIEGHERKEGEKVPSVAVTGRRSMNSQDRWDEISPMPIAWGTTDTAVIQEAKRAIPHDRWALLEKHKGKLSDVRDTKFNLLEL
ncbi:DUF3239 domain-containing protein [Corynebacterium sp. 153RC1]|uniref:DUF3239 domain-containing protein n=1 Tax=unclassified Corynebacterium TaxID=2624378 RepID=UPI00211B94FF|nr:MULTISPECIES: DUF3239 domain-containing protein [unclassified Corynebacterium]MCQ9353527.1 DUF3239 domain-containing protein [Corynebacterium sp. 209RC1]MCQ9355748.1 DUF3239 domain-containing protein [Corynebacterium sp. 1222RC1]MCQ9357913.1 DUF3239 domain-containing protein [Corynebacterium sp. 122RC1]MCQ9360109.1 DUF3239 domain-containing protein [Corynebacterium sp. 142RC1]MCQ9362252.1 DUF3239 domain-containing protein [Corynebacterium sp. 153RC1]